MPDGRLDAKYYSVSDLCKIVYRNKCTLKKTEEINLFNYPYDTQIELSDARTLRQAIEQSK